jgi:hypothetical protein
MAQGLDIRTIDRNIFYCPKLGTCRPNIGQQGLKNYPLRPKIIIFDV